jgi:hypothetical protein
MAQKRDYFGLSRIISLILAIIPFTSWICGVLTRFQEGKYVAAVVRLIGGFTVIWVIDLVLMVLNDRILRLLNI